MSIYLVHNQGPFWHDVIHELQVRGVEIGMVTSYSPSAMRESLANRGIEPIKVLDSQDFFDPQKADAAREALGSSPPPRGADFLERVGRSEADFLRITDRAAPFPKSVRYRTRLFYALARYWDAALEDSGVSAVVFTDVPHHGWDLVLDEVARIRELEVRVLTMTPFDGLIYFRDDYRAVIGPPADTSLPGTLEEAASSLRPSIQEALNGGSRQVAFCRSLIQQPQEFFEDSVPADERIGSERREALGWRIREFLETLLRGGKRLSQDFLVFDFHFHTAMNGVRSRLLRRVLRQFQRVHFWRLARAYRRLMRKRDSSRPYVLYMMHVQPERTTLPEAGRFADQQLAIETLAAALPEGWQLIVRENPRQLAPDEYNYIESFHFRSPADYEAIASIPRVRLSPLDQDVDQLLAGAEVVSTATGSSGWEGLTMGKPVVCFGTAWYAGCNSCYRGDRPGGIAEAIAAAQVPESEEVVRRDLLIFLTWLEAHLVPGALGDLHVEISSTPHDELVRGSVEGIINSLGL